MGSSASWGYEKEDEIVSCRHGHKSKYFDKCPCGGCIIDRQNRFELETQKRQIGNLFSSQAGKMTTTKRNDFFNKVTSLMKDYK